MCGIVDYDLCHKCFLKHGNSRDYSKIDTPLGKTRAQLQLDHEPYDSEVDNDDSQTEDDDSQVGDSDEDSQLDYSEEDSQVDDSEAENDMRLVLSRPLLKPVQHPRVACDMCRISPIVGIRYKSIRYVFQQLFEDTGYKTNFSVCTTLQHLLYRVRSLKTHISKGVIACDEYP